MEEKILFSNETEITDTNFKKMMFYKKFYNQIHITTLKLAICTFIIISSIILNMNEIDRIFCIFMAVIGIADTLKVKEQRADNITVLKYDFFDNCFQVNNSKITIEVDYNCVERIIDTNNYYYLVIQKSLMMISKSGFTVGKREEFKNIIENKRIEM